MYHFPAASFSSRAFTLVELVVVVALLSLIAGITYTGMSKYGQRQQFEHFASEVSSSIFKAKQQAVAAEGGTAWGVYVSQDTVEIFSGSTVTPGGSANTIITVPEYVQATSTFYSGDPFLIFAERTGAPNATGTITLADTRTLSTTTITIGASGLIEL